MLDAATARSSGQIPMDEPENGEVVRASIVAAHGQLFIRTTRQALLRRPTAIMVPGVRRCYFVFCFESRPRKSKKQRPTPIYDLLFYTTAETPSASRGW